jgi:hypothetical protein
MDVSCQIMLVDRLVEVVENLVGIGEGVVIGPRLEFETKGVQISVGPYPGVAK